MMNTIKVVAAVIKDKDRVLATQRGYGDYKDWWEFPGGKIEQGETPQQALRREISEELDIEIDVGEYITTVEYDYPKFHLSMDCFWAAISGGEITLIEHESAEWVPLSELTEVEWLPADRIVVDRIFERE